MCDKNVLDTGPVLMHYYKVLQRHVHHLGKAAIYPKCTILTIGMILVQRYNLAVSAFTNLRINMVILLVYSISQ